MYNIMVISQVGDYANTLTRSLTNTAKITDGDRKNMGMLSGFAKKLSQQLSDLMDELHQGRISIFRTQTAMAKTGSSPSGQPSVDTGFKDFETKVTAMPSLIYDGPFSDNIQIKKPLFIQGKAAVDEKAALSLAASFMGLPPKDVKSYGSTAGSLPTYNFASSTANISISKAGGYVVRLTNGRQIGPVKLNNDQARQKAAAFLRAHGINSMKESYYQTNNNVCVINYAFVQGDVVCYPDLIKVGVALDDGSVISFDSTGYLVNHHARNFASAKFGASEAEKLVSSQLKIQSIKLALIPMEDASESLCYEIHCKDKNGQDVLDYYNTASGREDQLLILLQTPGGVLAS